MRCIACDTRLKDSELTAKNPVTGEFLDTCTKCRQAIKGYTDELDQDAEDQALTQQIISDTLSTN